VVLDAVNNLSDALSSVVTILGAKLSAKKPDKKHPLGYGRIEYLSAMIVSALVLYAGVTSLVESVKKIIHPEAADYSILSLVLIAAAVAAKLFLGRYVKAQGRKADSASLVASGSDASFDAILSASVLLCAILYMTTGLALEAWVGVVISGFIIKSGIEMMLDTVNDILGSRMDPDLSKQVKGLICQEEGVSGAYDLLMTDYGPGRNYASVHMEVTDTATAEEIDRMTRRIQTRVHEETGLIITGIGIYSRNTHNAETAAIQKAVTEAVMAQEGTMGVHGFYVDTEARDMRFDTVFSFAVDPREALEKVRAAVEALYPEYSITITADVDLSD
jgi:cation diffusion facilitator family transporter